MMDYKDITQRIIDKGDRILAEKQQKKRRVVHIALKSCLVCGCVCLCAGTAVMWKLFIRPEINDGDRYPIVTTQITVTSQVTTNTTALTTTAKTESSQAAETSVTTSAYEEKTEPVTTAPTIREETVTQTAAISAVTVKETTAVTLSTAVSSEPETTVPLTTETTVTTTTTHYNYHPVDIFPDISLDGSSYSFNGVYLTKEQVKSFYIMWRCDTELIYEVPDSTDRITESVELLGVNEEDGRQEFIIVYYRDWDIYALYRSQ